ncbi:MAG: ADP-ribosylglycohydrolase family protein [Rikenellaceae bacterium]
MIGAIIGDIVGSRFEFNNTNRTDFELFTPECSYTDDTICTVAIADAILKGKSYKDSLLEWCRKYPNPKGSYGGSFAQWIHTADPQPYNSYGNGSAMRVSPIGWAFDDYKTVGNHACRSAAVSHNHEEGVKGAMCVANLIYHLRTGKIGKDAIKRCVKRSYGYEIPTVDYIRETNSFNETCQVTVPQAISCFLEANSFEETIRLAVSIGGDSDTIAAIAGSIAESYHPIPMKIWKHTFDFLPDDIIQVISEFIIKFNHNITTHYD